MSDYGSVGESTSGGAEDPPVAEPGDASSQPRAGLIASASAPGGERVRAAWHDSAATDDPEPSPAPPPSETGLRATGVELSAIEARVLGAMVEKSFLTPDIYPMTTNALVSACNQKTNRDPVVSYGAVEIDATLLELRQRELVRRVHAQGNRATKHRQTLDEALGLDERELVLLSVLLLRGPQTVGELRLRTERHEVGFDDLETVERCLETLAARATPLVRQLPRQPGHKENRWTHLLADSAASAAESEGSGGAALGGGNQGAVPDASVHQAVTAAPATDRNSAALAGRVDDLEAEVATLRRQLAALAASLGEELE